MLLQKLSSPGCPLKSLRPHLPSTPTPHHKALSNSLPTSWIDTAVTKVLPFAVCEVEGLPNDPRDLVDEALAENFAEEYKVKKWPLNVVHDETCVEVRMRFTRTKTRSAEE